MNEALNTAVEATEVAVESGMDTKYIAAFVAGAVTIEVTRLVVKKVKAGIEAKKATKAEAAKAEEVKTEE